MDEAVLRAQKWVNETYLRNNGYAEITEDGITGQNTVKALTIALQLELGIQGANGTFGPATEKLCPTLSKNVNASPSNTVRILQHGLFCKGYSPAGVTGIFGDNTENAIKQVQGDAGLTQNGIVTPLIFKTILNTDPLILAPDGDAQIRYIQQQLNNKYNAYFGIIPCNGKYERNTNKALIYALQAEEGLKVGTANGSFGPTTQQLCPVLSMEDTEPKPAFVKILKYALKCNGMSISSFDGTFDEETKNCIISFQDFLVLPEKNGVANLDVWLSLLTSKGNTDRPVSGCDCATVITEENISVLVKNGYRFIGRYLTGRYKLSQKEIAILSTSHIRIFPIFQRSGEGISATNVGYFTISQAESDANDAIMAALQLGFPSGTIIYFAVDYDAYDIQVTKVLIPFFQKLSEVFRHKSFCGYKIGIYGPRNVCTRISQLGYAISSFVSDMSTGYSGNLGYAMPSNWTFDQIVTTVISDPDTGKSIEIDKDAVRGMDAGEEFITDYLGQISFEEAHKRALSLTSDFEGGQGYKNIAGNGDGQGLSLGIIQFNIGRGTLQPLFSDIIAENKEVVLDALGEEKTAQLEHMLTLSLEQQKDWAVSINDGNNKILDEWKTVLLALCDTPEFCAIQDRYVEDYKQRAIKKCYLFFGFSTCRAYAFMFDYSVQCGGFNSGPAATIEARITEDMTELEKLNIIAEFYSSLGAGGCERRMCIAKGTGIVNGSTIDISAYGIDDRIIYNMPPSSIEAPDSESD